VGVVVIGREPEIARLARMVAAARTGQGGAIALYGEAGIGKSALLAHVADSAAANLLVLRAVGVEAESELPFAALHLLLRPARHLIDRLPAIQREALRRAFREEQGEAPDRFLIGLAVLTLLVDGLPELRLSALSRADCERLLAERAAELGPRARDRVIDEAEGNPLALLHFAASLSAEQRSGHLAPLPLGASEPSGGGRLEPS
jgi:hypothetical protein